MAKLPDDYTSEVNPKKPSDFGEPQPLKTPKAKNAGGNMWHGFKAPPKK